MEELLIVLIQFFIEILLESLCYLPAERGSKFADVYLPLFYWFCGGCVVALVSLMFFKTTFIAYPVLRVVNLVLAPIVSGYIAEAVASRRAEQEPAINPGRHYWQAFWFTLGLVVFRFTLAARP